MIKEKNVFLNKSWHGVRLDWAYYIREFTGNKGSVNYSNTLMYSEKVS